MSEQIPIFRYHPDPVSTGSVVSDEVRCYVCGLARGLIYAGPLTDENDDEVHVCPWCIADGTAAVRLDVEFTMISMRDGEGVHGDVLSTISARTPGFVGWQQERWLFHCSDGAAFLGPVGADVLRQHADAMEAIEEECRESGWSEVDARTYIDSIAHDSSPTAYMFRCLRCGMFLAYSDFI